MNVQARRQSVRIRSTTEQEKLLGRLLVQECLEEQEEGDDGIVDGIYYLLRRSLDLNQLLQRRRSTDPQQQQQAMSVSNNNTIESEGGGSMKRQRESLAEPKICQMRTTEENPNVA